MSSIPCNLKVCFRKKRNKYLAAFLFIILVNILILSYLTCCKFPPEEDVQSPYALRPYERNLVKQDNSETTVSNFYKFNQTCIEKRNFVFIKGMKCATSTLLGVFYRFGYTRNLSFVSPVGNLMYLNWPFPMTMRDFRPSSRGYNILTDHAVYTEDVMERIMPNDTIYISILREPFAQMRSTMLYFKIAKIAGVGENVTNHIVEYFSNLEKYESVYTSNEAKYRWCIPDGLSLTRNIMSHCHGMPLGFPPGTKSILTDNDAIKQYFQKLDSKFSLIMIVEYFYESLILLRRLMCWSFRDIVFINSNTGDYSNKYASVPENILDIHKQWSSIDYRLYNYFNKTLWERISHQSSDFYKEIEVFQLVETQVQNYCLKLYKTFKREEYPVNMTEIVVEPSEWNERFAVTSEDCWMLGPNPYLLRNVVQAENDVQEAILLAEQKKIPDNRTLKGVC